MVCGDSRAAISDFGLYDMRNDTAFYPVMAWDPVTVDFNIWLGNATAEIILRLGSHVRAGPLIAYEPGEKHPSGWAYRVPGRIHAPYLV
jgi:hypothetical protein